MAVHELILLLCEIARDKWCSYWEHDPELGSYGDMSDPVGRCSFECIGSYLQTVLPSLIHRSYLVKHRVYWSDLNSWMIGGVWRPAEVLWWLMKSGANDAYACHVAEEGTAGDETD